MSININELTIGQAKELASLFRDEQAGKRVDHGIKIVVLDKGFVYVGRVVTDGEWVEISKAKNIRRWGTSRGLGELREGPLSDTVLDDVGKVKAPFHALQHLIDAVEGKWISSL